MVQDLGTGQLPHPVMSMPEFKTFIGFEEVEDRQAKFLVMDIQSGGASG
jgi:methylisocitrate lyase